MTSIPWDKGAGLNGDADHSLAGKAFAGDREAFARVVEVHQLYVSRLAQRLLGWDPEVEDVVQDVFASAWQRRKQLRDPERLRSWLAAITVNATRSRLRRRKLRRAFMIKMTEMPREARHDSTPADETMEREEAGRQVREAMNELPQRDKELLVLRYLEHMEVSEIAEAMGLRVNAVQVRLHRARKRLADLLPRELQA